MASYSGSQETQDFYLEEREPDPQGAEVVEKLQSSVRATLIPKGEGYT